jgi:acetyl-CoA synthetase
VKDVSFNKDDFRIRWYADGELNVSVNCLDRHIAERGDQAAILWESDDGLMARFTYKEALAEVCRIANVLKAKGVKKGDRVDHLPADDPGRGLLRCSPAPASARSTPSIFGGFSRRTALAGRIQSTATSPLRHHLPTRACAAASSIPLKENAIRRSTSPLKSCPSWSPTCIVVRRTKADVPMTGWAPRRLLCPYLQAAASVSARLPARAG